MKTTTTFTRVVERHKLLEKDLVALINRDILALRIYPFIDIETCESWQLPLENTSKLSRYSNATDVSVNRIGMTLFETENKPEKLESYFREADKTFPMVEKLLNGDNPIHEIHSAIRNAWELGCIIEQMDKQNMTPGIIRSFEANPEGGLPPHIDTLFKDVPGIPEFKKMQCQLASNLYISTADEGGELEVWDYEPNDNELKDLYNGSYDFIDREKLPAPPTVFKPKVGELILFRSSCIHSVRPSRGGMRTAASCFIGYYGDDKPMSVWA